MRKTARVMALAAAVLGACATFSGSVQAALNGTLYAVEAPLYDGSTGSTSFLRLYGGVSSASSTFTIRIVNATSGANMGNVVTISVPSELSTRSSIEPSDRSRWSPG